MKWEHFKYISQTFAHRRPILINSQLKTQTQFSCFPKKSEQVKETVQRDQRQNKILPAHTQLRETCCGDQFGESHQRVHRLCCDGYRVTQLRHSKAAPCLLLWQFLISSGCPRYISWGEYWCVENMGKFSFLLRNLHFQACWNKTPDSPHVPQSNIFCHIVTGMEPYVFWMCTSLYKASKHTALKMF